MECLKKGSPVESVDEKPEAGLDKCSPPTLLLLAQLVNGAEDDFAVRVPGARH